MTPLIEDSFANNTDTAGDLYQYQYQNTYIWYQKLAWDSCWYWYQYWNLPFPTDTQSYTDIKSLTFFPNL